MNLACSFGIIRTILEMQMSDRDFYRAPEVGQVHSTLEVGHQPDPPQIYSFLQNHLRERPFGSHPTKFSP